MSCQVSFWGSSIVKYIYIYIHTHTHTHTNLPVSDIVGLPHSWSGDSQGQETFLAPSADKQTCNYDTECSNYMYIYNIYIHIIYNIYIYIYIFFLKSSKAFSISIRSVFPSCWSHSIDLQSKLATFAISKHSI